MTKRKIDVCIVSHKTLTNPITENLRIFLNAHYQTKLLFMNHPLLELKESFERSSEYEYMEDGILTETHTAFHWQLPVPFLYLKDFIYTLIWCLKFNRVWDIYFGVGNLNPISGIILKKLGRVKKVIYWSMDYYPKRFENKFLDWLYFLIDDFCVKNCDETWNVSAMMVKARNKKMGFDQKRTNKQKTVTQGVWYFNTRRLPFEKINQKKIVYRGYLIPHMGVDLIVRAMPLIIKKIPGAFLEIAGGGDQEEELKMMAEDLKVSRSIRFNGFIRERKKLEKLICDGAIGIATFNTKILDDKVKNADPGKIKDYMLFGMPVIITDAVYYHKKIDQLKCGVTVKYDPKDLASKLISLLSNESKLRLYRQNAENYIKNLDWDIVLDKNIKRVLAN